jgi:hypothetical protein
MITRIAWTRFNRSTRRVILAMMLPVMTVALGFLPALSPVAAAEDEITFEPDNAVSCEIVVQQAPEGQCIVPGSQSNTTGTVPPAPAARPDSDDDGLYDDDELNVYGTDPWAWDTDGDGSSDGEEVYYGTNPLG